MTLLRWAIVVLLCWYVLLAIISLLLPAGRPLLVFAPGRAIVVATSIGRTFEGGSSNFAYTRSDDPRFIYRLYWAGAVLVLDGATVKSCRSIINQAFNNGP